MRAVTTSIVHEDPFLAGREAASELLAQMGKMDLVLVFTTSRHPPERVVEGLFSRLPPSVALVGCSSFAEINAEDALSRSVTAMGLALGEVAFEVITLESVAESTDAGRDLARRALAFGASLVIVLPDVSAVNGAKLIRGMRERLGTSCAVIGGVPSDHLEYKGTFQISGQKVLRGGVVAVALKGPIAVTTSAKAGFQPLGAPRTCTRVEGDGLVLELDGVPALDLYREFLGEEVMSRPRIGLEYPLAVVTGPGADYMNSDERSQVIRVVRSLDYERRGVLCSDIQEGAKVRLTRATKDDLINAAALSAEEAKRGVPSPAFALVFDCAGRRLVLGARHDEEIKAVRDKLGGDVPMIGFYTFGELSPVEGTPAYHAQTFTIALIGSPPHAM